MARATLTLAVAAALCVMGCAGPQSADEAPPATSDASPSSEQRAYIDPTTGELVTPPEQGKRTGPPAASKDGYTIRQRPDGTVEMRPEQPARHTIRAQEDDDGEITYSEDDDDGR